VQIVPLNGTLGTSNQRLIGRSAVDLARSRGKYVGRHRQPQRCRAEPCVGDGCHTYARELDDAGGPPHLTNILVLGAAGTLHRHYRRRLVVMGLVGQIRLLSS